MLKKRLLLVLLVFLFLFAVTAVRAQDDSESSEEGVAETGADAEVGEGQTSGESTDAGAEGQGEGQEGGQAEGQGEGQQSGETPATPATPASHTTPTKGARVKAPSKAPTTSNNPNSSVPQKTMTTEGALNELVKDTKTITEELKKTREQIKCPEMLISVQTKLTGQVMNLTKELSHANIQIAQLKALSLTSENQRSYHDLAAACKKNITTLTTDLQRAHHKEKELQKQLHSLQAEIKAMEEDYREVVTVTKTGDAVYEGIVHGHPRIRIPLEPASKPACNGYKGPTIIQCGSYRFHMFGVNHVTWPDKNMYLWPTSDLPSYAFFDLARFNKVCPNQGKMRILQHVKNQPMTWNC